MVAECVDLLLPEPTLLSCNIYSWLSAAAETTEIRENGGLLEGPKKVNYYKQPATEGGAIIYFLPLSVAADGNPTRTR